MLPPDATLEGSGPITDLLNFLLDLGSRFLPILAGVIVLLLVFSAVSSSRRRAHPGESDESDAVDP